MDKDLRASLAAAGAAAALSALVGIVAGVGFFVLMLRALIGGLLLGAAVYCGIIVIRRALPGIADAPAAAAPEGESVAAVPELGANVDIVLPGEAEEAEELGPGADSLVARLIPEGESEAEYVEEGSLLEPEPRGAETEAAIPPNARADHERRPSVGFDELDVLPDLDGFADSFTASEFAYGGSPESAERPGVGRGNGSSGGSSGPKSAQDGPDPAALAQAVRTILKRDQKG